MYLKTVCEIPVYSMSEEEFENYFYDNSLKDYEEHPDFEMLKQANRIDSIWRFNQIIGYITVSVEKQDIVFEVYKNTKKVFPLSSKKNPMQCQYLNGFHFRASGLSNDEIANRINYYIEQIGKEFFNGRYIDKETLYNIIYLVNYSKILES